MFGEFTCVVLQLRVLVLEEARECALHVRVHLASNIWKPELWQ